MPMPDQQAPGAPDTEPTGQAPNEQESKIIDQIGTLMQQLSPELQSMVISKLSDMEEGQESDQEKSQEAGAGTVSPEGGPNGKPVSQGGY